MLITDTKQESIIIVYACIVKYAENYKWRTNTHTNYVIKLYIFFSAHARTSSEGSVPEWSFMDMASESNFKCFGLFSIRAHQQPITVLDFEGGRVLTGSQDHTLKVSWFKILL